MQGGNDGGWGTFHNRKKGGESSGFQATPQPPASAPPPAQQNGWGASQSSSSGKYQSSTANQHTSGIQDSGWGALRRRREGGADNFVEGQASAPPASSQQSHGWGASPASSQQNDGWGAAPAQPQQSDGWGSQSGQADAWGAQPAQSQSNGGWGAEPAPSQQHADGGWGAESSQTQSAGDEWGAPAQSGAVDDGGWGAFFDGKKPGEDAKKPNKTDDESDQQRSEAENVATKDTTADDDRGQAQDDSAETDAVQDRNNEQVTTAVDDSNASSLRGEDVDGDKTSQGNQTEAGSLDASVEKSNGEAVHSDDNSQASHSQVTETADEESPAEPSAKGKEEAGAETPTLEVAKDQAVSDEEHKTDAGPKSELKQTEPDSQMNDTAEQSHITAPNELQNGVTPVEPEISVKDDATSVPEEHVPADIQDVQADAQPIISADAQPEESAQTKAEDLIVDPQQPDAHEEAAKEETRSGTPTDVQTGQIKNVGTVTVNSALQSDREVEQVASNVEVSLGQKQPAMEQAESAPVNAEDAIKSTSDTHEDNTARDTETSESESVGDEEAQDDESNNEDDIEIIMDMEDNARRDRAAAEEQTQAESVSEQPSAASLWGVEGESPSGEGNWGESGDATPPEAVADLSGWDAPATPNGKSDHREESGLETPRAAATPPAPATPPPPPPPPRRQVGQLGRGYIVAKTRMRITDDGGRSIYSTDEKFKPRDF